MHIYIYIFKAIQQFEIWSNNKDVSEVAFVWGKSLRQKGLTYIRLREFF